MRKVNVYGQDYKIHYVKDLAITHGDDGACYPSRSRIEIEKDCNDKEQTTLHELGHALFHRLGWSQGIDDNLEEIIVETYATFITENFEIKWKKKKKSLALKS